MPPVEMTCMTTKKKFLVDDPPVVRLANGRYAYKVECPWKGKEDKTLHAWKFASKEAADSQPPQAEHEESEVS